MSTTPEHEAFLKRLADPRYYGEQDENGIDLSLIRRNLTLSAHERLARASRSRKNLLRLRYIGRTNTSN